MAFIDVNGNSVSIGSSSASTGGYNYSKWNGKYLVVHGNSLTGWGSHLASFLGMASTIRINSGGSLTGTRNTTTEMQTYVETIYPSKADLILLQGDGNTMTNAYGEFSDQLDGDDPKQTWCARVNYLIRCLKSKYPNAVIALLPDSVWYEGEQDSRITNKNRNNYNAMKGIAEYNRLYFIPVDSCTPYDPVHGTTNHYTGYKVGQDGVIDYVHPNAKYLDAKAKAIAHYVAGFVFDPSAPNSAVDGWQDNVM